MTTLFVITATLSIVVFSWICYRQANEINFLKGKIKILNETLELADKVIKRQS